MPFDRKAYQAEYRRTHRKQANAYARAYREACPELVAQANKKWSDANKPHLKAYYQANRERELAQMKVWDKTHPVNVKASIQKRRARLKGSASTLTPQELGSIRNSIIWCDYCLQPSGPLQVEHCTPLSRGGTNSADNVVMACSSCNLRKGTKTVLEFTCIL